MEYQVNTPPLREQVYTYLRQQMNLGALIPGSTINLGEIAKQLGISKTPLRDALIHLEIEGFVTIIPRRGVRVNLLELRDVKNAYDTIGVIENSIILDCFESINRSHISQLEELNNKMVSDIKKNDFNRLFDLNLRFHDVYLNVSDNDYLKKFIIPIKQRLYDFPRKNYIKEWEIRNCEEHRLLIDHIKAGCAEDAAKILKDVHWSFDYQKDFIKEFYNFED
ncbi:MAG: GntR family transcriptional regulator [Desulfobacteraceae bacterium]|nr:GntR family transcriptional regulator [Desulfobacteraceae bacterium]